MQDPIGKVAKDKGKSGSITQVVEKTNLSHLRP
jgi:hypothetical protein